MLVTGLALFVGLTITVVEDILFARQNAQTQLTLLADVIANNASTALLANDAQSADGVMQLFAANELVLNAQIIDENQNVFVAYQAHESHVSEATLASQILGLSAISISQPVVVNKLELGVLNVYADIAPVWEDLITQWLAKLAVLSTIFLVSYLVLRNTSKYILEPVKRLTKAIGEITENGNYALRVEAGSRDELSALTDAFNLMLAQIEDRDNQLQQSNEALAQVQEPIVLRDTELLTQRLQRLLAIRLMS